jgi:carboxyl-terminal processing protease
MNKKISVGLMLTIVFIAVATAIAITMSVSMRTYNSLIKDLPQRAQMYSGIAEIDEIVRAEYYGDVNQLLLASSLSKGYADGLGDKYSYYMTADEYNEYTERIGGKNSTIGIVPFLDPDTGYIYVSKVFDNSAAQTAKIEKGDEITAINGENVTSGNYSDMVKQLYGDKYTNLVLTVLHGEKTSDVKVVLGYNMQSVSYDTVGKIGVIRITAFYENTAVQLSEAIKTLQKEDITGLIIDLRNCSEGTVKYAANAVDVIVPVASEGRGAIAVIQNSKGETVDTYTADAKSITLPLAVLVNNGTNGPAELFACTLMDYGRADLVGTVTAGNATLQDVFKLSDGGAIRLTVATVLPYKSESYNDVGITPNYEVEMTADELKHLYMLSNDKDPQFQKAYSLLSE